jgi:hypothetical protein
VELSSGIEVNRQHDAAPLAIGSRRVRSAAFYSPQSGASIIAPAGPLLDAINRTFRLAPAGPLLAAEPFFACDFLARPKESRQGWALAAPRRWRSLGGAGGGRDRHADSKPAGPSKGSKPARP